MDKQQYYLCLLKYNRRKLLESNLYCQFGGKYKWKTLTHNGVMFPPEYEPHGKPLTCVIDGVAQKIALSPGAEEAAMMYAKYITTDYVKNKTFNKNFWNDWKKLLVGTPITSLDQCDFTEYNQILVQRKEEKKEKEKEGKEDDTKYKEAIVDGKPQPVGNFRIEPPGIFLGRGDNPKIGKIKGRIYPEDITINIDREHDVPPSLEGHQWGKIVHDQHVEWLASWKDTITGKMKYVWLGAHSDTKAASDQHKFDLAMKLKRKIKHITEQNELNLASSDRKTRETAVALYFIDKLALRVGNEKASDETDTVGVTSLRVEHLKLLDDHKITLDFLGKDSVRYLNTITVDPLVYRNLQEFVKDKDGGDNIFDHITSNDINKYLQTFMKDLTAKVFRTYNASNVFQKELKKITKKYEGVENKALLMDEYNKANAKVAILCNHQKNIGKSHKGQVDRIKQQLRKAKTKLRKAVEARGEPAKIEELRTKVKVLQSKKELKCQLKNISLGTSRANYIDPRITVAFMKLHNLPVDKIFSKALQQKFSWAFSAEKDFKF